jgi:hypothetical protein
MQARTEASRCRWVSRRKSTSSRWMMLCLLGVQTVWHVVQRLGLWTDERPDGMARFPDGWQGTGISDSQIVLILLNRGIPVEKHLFTYKWFCPIRMRPTTNEHEFSNLQTVQNLQEHFWITESLIKNIFTKKWFCLTECGQLQTNKTSLVFLIPWTLASHDYLSKNFLNKLYLLSQA